MPLILKKHHAKINCLSNTFKKFYGRDTDLVGQYKKNVCQMFADSIKKMKFTPMGEGGSHR